MLTDAAGTSAGQTDQTDDLANSEDVTDLVNGLDTQITNMHTQLQSGDHPQVHATARAMRQSLASVKQHVADGAKLRLVKPKPADVAAAAPITDAQKKANVEADRVRAYPPTR